jgi:hypothetical protein
MFGQVAEKRRGQLSYVQSSQRFGSKCECVGFVSFFWHVLLSLSRLNVSGNVDWGLLNFMEDWFPRESREKLKANEREVVNEQLTEWRRNEADCVII